MTTQANLIKEEDIDEYLRKNPEYFVPRDQLLLELKIPHPSGGAISLLEKQIALLRTQHASLKGELKSAIDIAREQESFSQKLKNITLQLLDIQDFESLIAFLDDQLCQEQQANQMHLLLSKQTSKNPLKDYVSPLKKSALDTFIRNILRTGQAQTFQASEATQQLLFPTIKNPNFNEVLVLPLGVDGSIGLISLGGESLVALDDAKQLNFMNYLGNLLERIIPKLSSKPD